MLSAERQKKNDKYCMKSLIRRILKKKEEEEETIGTQHGIDAAVAGGG